MLGHGDELPEAVVFGESADHTVIIAFPAPLMREMQGGGVLRDFPSLRSQGSTYYRNNKAVTIQYRIPLLFLSRLERAISPYVRLRRLRETSDMDSPQRSEPDTQ
jgi:hypothetical protein